VRKAYLPTNLVGDHWPATRPKGAGRPGPCHAGRAKGAIKRVDVLKTSTLMRPTEAAKAIEAALPFKFTSGLFTKSWRKLGVRPPVGDPLPCGRTTSNATTTSVTTTTDTRRRTWPRSSGNAARNKSFEIF
jgi:hypothetical protein